MAHYFLAHPGDLFEREVRPALGSAWLQRSFQPCQAMSARLLPAALRYAAEYHTGEAEPLLARVAAGLAFDRTLWRMLVAEVLLYGAEAIPELQLNEEALACLLGVECPPDRARSREELPPVLQAHRGSRPLQLGPIVYQEAQTGYHDRRDVARLHRYLAGVDPGRWTPDDLLPLAHLADEETRADELAFVREWLPALVELYRDADEAGRVIVVEEIF